MRIGIVCYPTYGGSGVVATELGKALANKGNSVHFITYKQPARLDTFHSNIFYHEVRLLEYPLFEHPPYETVLASKLVDVVRFEKLDLLHVHYAIPHASAAFMAKQILATYGINIPVITTLHGTDITLVGKDATYAPVVEFSINKSDGVTAVSEHLKEETHSFFDIENEIKVIPNFIDFSRFKKENKDHFRKAIAPNNEKILIHISNFRKVKRTLDVIRIYHQVSKELPAKLLLIGDGPERGKAENLCRELGTCEHVRFLGKQEAIEELLAISDVFLLPSEKESFGLVALEAMSCHVPVVSSNAGGIPEVNIHGETGFLSPIGDVDSMAKQVLKLLKDEKLLLEFRKNALDRAKNFSLEKVLPHYENYYKEVIEKTAAKVVLK
ncbi:MAG: N-acetyl-alpha-D-glucosaminyl L-malate synthase BshA [Chitinophagaceae bacterium]|nr:MAG: N-acetyl-alpha-D-glucosaminyl L-malate synthase BshA [Chitinophagaceae bacterium]